MHCDALTQEGVFQISKKNLRDGGCHLQCFALFIKGEEARYARANAQIDKFERLCQQDGYHPVTSAKELKEDEINALLTVEGGGVFEGDLQTITSLYNRGVRMCAPVWNEVNELGFPAVLEGERGLTPFGFEAVERMNELGIIVDLSHASDKLLFDVASVSSCPFVASHSNAREVYFHRRNLSNEGIRAIAKSGGLIGLNFYENFLSQDKSREGQLRALLAHAEHILNVGGENVLAIGSDFDGIPSNPYLKNPTVMPLFLQELCKKFGERIAEKIAYFNFIRVFSQVCK